MATTIKPVLSSKNRYHISKHRYYELKHFCLQYPEWKRIYNAVTLELSPRSNTIKPIIFDKSEYSDPTGDLGAELATYARNMELIEKTAERADLGLRDYILKAVTEGLSYTALKSLGMPCERDMYYDRYRKFFWLLDKER